MIFASSLTKNFYLIRSAIILQSPLKSFYFIKLCIEGDDFIKRGVILRFLRLAAIVPICSLKSVNFKNCYHYRMSVTDGLLEEYGSPLLSWRNSRMSNSGKIYSRCTLLFFVLLALGCLAVAPAFAISASPDMPTFSQPTGSYVGTQTVTISADTGVMIFYTINGNTPTEVNGKAAIGTLLYTKPLLISATTTLQAIAYVTGVTPSAVSSATYTLSCVPPTFSVLAGTYNVVKSVTLKSLTTGATVLYTTDGNTPSEINGVPTGTTQVYSTAIPITVTTNLQAIAYKSGLSDSATSSAIYTLQCYAPTINIKAGTYTVTKSVTLSCRNVGASIYYTTDGTTPSASSQLYTAGTPVLISASATLTAIAILPGWSPSATSSASYTLQCVAPRISAKTANYIGSKAVTLSTTTAGASIYYTTDGSTPSAASQLYTAPITISADTTLNAIAVLAGWTDSVVSSAVYTIQCLAPTFAPRASSYTGAQTVAITTLTAGASIIYTTDGSTPTEGNGTTIASGATVTLSITSTLKAIATMGNMNDSLVTTGVFTIKCVAPIFTPKTGALVGAQQVTLFSSTAGSSIIYTIDGSTPSEIGGVPQGTATMVSDGASITISGKTTLKAFAYLAGATDSAITTAAYTVQCVAPTFSPVAGTYYGASNVVTISTPMIGAIQPTIRYTTDGSLPSTTKGILYSAPITITAASVELQAIAYATGLTTSTVSNSTYNLLPTAAPPTFSPVAGTYAGTQKVTISSTTPGATIYYTTDGSTPTVSSKVYTTPVWISANITLSAIATVGGLGASTVTTGIYNVTPFQCVAPTMSPVSGTSNVAETVTLSTTTAGALIFYTLDGTTPTEVNGVASGTTLLYTAPISVSQTTTIEAIAYESGLTDSTVSSGTYTLQNVTPTISVAAGTYYSAQTVTLSTPTTGATIYYTLDGTTPGAVSGLVYTAPLTISASSTLQAIAIQSGWSDSGIASAAYVIAAMPTIVAPANQTIDLGGSTGALTFTTSNGIAPLVVTASSSDDTQTVAVNNNTVTVSGGIVGTDTITLTVTDANNMTAQATFTVVVNALPTIVAPDNQTIDFGLSTGALTFTASNGTAPLTVTASSSDGTQTVTVNNNTVTVSGGAVGTATITLTVTDANNQTAQATFTVTVNALPTIVAPANQVYDLGGSTSALTFTASNGIAPLTVTASSSDDTQTVTVDNGTVTVSGGAVGTATITLTVTDAANQTAQATFTVTVLAPVANPTFTPAAGAYIGTQTVAISTTTSGASINYTTDGSTPSDTNGTLYAGPISITASETVTAIAFKTGMADSAVVSAAYAITPQAVAPTFSPIGGIFSAPVTVTINTTAVGNTIFYTTDGSTPTEVGGIAQGSSIIGASGTTVTVSATTTLKAISYTGGGVADSQVASGSYFFSSVQLSGDYYSNNAPVYGGSDSGNGGTNAFDGNLNSFYDGNDNSGDWVGLDFGVGASMVISQMSYCPRLNNGQRMVGCEFQGSNDPTFNTGVVTLATISSAPNNSTLTTIASSDTTDSFRYVRYLGVANSYTNVAEIEFFGAGTLSAPTFTPAAGTFAAPQTVTLSAPQNNLNQGQPKATFFYTTDGSTPSEIGGVAQGTTQTSTGSLIVSVPTTLKAIDSLTGLTDSTVSTSGLYTITDCAAPTFSLAAGTYNSAQSITLSTLTTGATIRYTTDGTTPSETNGTVYTTPVAINSSTTLQAIAYLNGLTDSSVSSAVYTLQVVAPTLSPIAGSYGNAVTATISTTTSGATIYYTTDGSTPSETSATLTNGGTVRIPVTATLQAIAALNGWEDSTVSSGTYVISTICATPTFTPAAGSYTGVQTVTINTSTIGASIIYTTDGTTPAETGGTATNGTSIASGATVTISANTTLKAIAYDSGLTDSTVASGVYGIQAEQPTFSPAGGAISGATTVTLSSTTAGATIIYTTDGTTPTETAGIPNGTALSVLSGGTITISSTTLLKAISYVSGMTDSNVTSGQYATAVLLSGVLFSTNDQVYGGDPTHAPSMAFDGSTSTFFDAQNSSGEWLGQDFGVGASMQISQVKFFPRPDIPGRAFGCSFQASNDPTFTTGVVTLFTVPSADGSAQLYTGTSLDTTDSFRYVRYVGGTSTWTDVAELQFFGAGTLGAPTFSLNAGSFATPQTVSITSPQNVNIQGQTHATIFYTTDGTTPSESNGVATGTTLTYTGPLTISTPTTLKAIAYLTGFTDSSVASNAYTITTVTAPTFAPTAGTFNTAQTVTISTITSGATIRYTTDGTTPSESNGIVYTAPVALSVSTTLQAIAYEAGMTDSAVTSGTFTLQVVQPTFTPGAAAYGLTQNVTISTTTSGATIRYTTDGSTPSESNGTVYTAPVSISVNETLQAIAYLNGWSDSSVTSGSYVISNLCIAPTFTPVAGTFSSTQTVVISTTTNGGSIIYTTDGSTPSESNGTVTNGISIASGASVAISTPTNLKAIAYGTGLVDSSVTSGQYNFQCIAPTFSPAAGAFVTGPTVTISSTTSGATIIYTTDGTTPSEIGGVPQGTSLAGSSVTISANTTLQAIAYKSGYVDSNVTSGAYAFAALLGGTPFGATNPRGGSAASVFDGSITTGYTTNSSSGDYLGLDLGAGSSITLAQLMYYPRTDQLARTVNCQLQVSNDKSTWTTIYTVPTQPTAAWQTVNASTPGFTAPNGPFRYVRWYGNGTWCDCEELQFYGAGTLAQTVESPAVSGSTMTVTVTAPENGTAQGQAAASIFYTTDGTTPTHSGGTATGTTTLLTASTITVNVGTTLQVIESATGFTDSVPNIIQGYLLDNGNYATATYPYTNINGGGGWSNSPSNAFDGIASTSNYSDGGSTSWTGIDFGSGHSVIVNWIYFYPRASQISRMNGGMFQGSNDGTTWTTIYTVGTAAAGWNAAFALTNNSTRYRYLRYQCASGGYADVSEIQFYGNYQ
jgi:AraC-like DNA-binding protein